MNGFDGDLKPKRTSPDSGSLPPDSTKKKSD